MSVKNENQWLIAILLLIVCLTLSTWLFSLEKQPNTDEGEEAHAEGEAGHEESEKRKEV